MNQTIIYDRKAYSIDLPSQACAYAIEPGDKGGRRRLIIVVRKRGESKDAAITRVAERHPNIEFIKFDAAYVMDALPGFGVDDSELDEMIMDIYEDQKTGRVGVLLDRNQSVSRKLLGILNK